MTQKFNLISLIFIMITHNCVNVFANDITQKQTPQIEPGIYILVSFSMNDTSLRAYFDQAQHYGAKLVMRGLSGDKTERNRFADTKAKAEKAKINFDINPLIFKQLNITKVPVIIVAKEDGSFSKINGHIGLCIALEMMNIDNTAMVK
jgi:type-F conjugative transfer system pilin assembly protein TrbC